MLTSDQENLHIFRQQFEEAFPLIRKGIKEACNSGASDWDLATVWKVLELLTTTYMKTFLVSFFNILEDQIVPPDGKSDYPDMEIVFGEISCAIDIKTATSSQAPGYDMGRLDTYEEDHLKKYAWEYCVTIKWNEATKQVIEVYIESTIHTVGRSQKSGGLKYRKKEGNLRPKSWTDFAKGKIYWLELEDFKLALAISGLKRHRILISEWYTMMKTDQRQIIRQDLDKIDAEQIPPVLLLEDTDE